MYNCSQTTSHAYHIAFQSLHNVLAIPMRKFALLIPFFIQFELCRTTETSC